MSRKISPYWIVRDHFATLRLWKHTETSRWDVFVFYVLPAIAAGALTWLIPSISEGALNMTLTVVSIFAGLLLNLLVLIYSIVPKDKGSINQLEAKWVCLRAVFANISYTVLVCLVSIVDMGLLKVLHGTLALPVVYLLFFFLGHFILTMLMILNSVHNIMHTEFDPEERK
jgi:hypothetical protein